MYYGFFITKINITIINTGEVVTKKDKKPLNIKVGKRIAYYRNKYKLTQDELAEKTGLTQKGLSLIENGDTFPRSETLMVLSSFFRTDVKNFFDFNDTKSKEEKIKEIESLIEFINDDDSKLESLLLFLKNLV